MTMKILFFIAVIHVALGEISAQNGPIFERLQNAIQGFKCDFGYELKDEDCYRLNQPANYEEALKICLDDGSELVSIHNLETNSYVEKQSGEVLIGLRFTKEVASERIDEVKETKSHTMEFDADYSSNVEAVSRVRIPEENAAMPEDINEVTVRWSDGSPVDFLRNEKTLKKWRPYFGECVAVTSTGWKNVQCTEKLAFLCRKKVERVCEDGYENFGGHCYALYQTPEVFDDAERQCVSEGGHLASVQNDKEKKYLTSLGENVEKQLGYNGKRWTDGSSTSFLGYYGDLAHLCLTWGRSSYYDNDDPQFDTCSFQAGPFICQKPERYITNRACPLSNIFTNSETITSPGYPRKYHTETRLECNYFFAALNSHLARVSFEQFDMADDYILVHEGWNVSSRTPIGIVRKHNFGVPRNFTTTSSNLMSVQFIGRSSGIWKAHFDYLKKPQKGQAEEKDAIHVTPKMLCALLRPQMQYSNSSNPDGTSDTSSFYETLCKNF